MEAEYLKSDFKRPATVFIQAICTEEVKTPNKNKSAFGIIESASLAIISGDKKSIGMYWRFSDETFGIKIKFVVGCLISANK